MEKVCYLVMALVLAAALSPPQFVQCVTMPLHYRRASSGREEGRSRNN